MGRIANSWLLVKASAAVLRADKELIVFPIISGLGTLLVTLTFAVPILLSGMLQSVSEGGGQAVGIVVAFLFYLSQYTVIFFCNSALVGAATIRLKGGDPTLGDGFRIAARHFGAIVGYALISATVGMVLRAIAERGILGRIAASLFGVAWNLATYFTVPILVNEGVGPIDAVKRSAQLLKKTWGEQVAGNLGIGTVSALVILALCLVFVPAIVGVAVLTESAPLTIAVGALFGLSLLLVGLVSSALGGIYATAVYRYATTGNAGTFFDTSLVKDAFRTKG